MKLSVPKSFELCSGRGSSPGCIIGILHWILCKSLTNRSCADEVEESRSGNEVQTNSPGIVARLMGIESFQANSHTHSETIPLIHSSSEQMIVNVSGSSHLRKSQSVMDVPTYLKKENEEFLVLSFGVDDDSESSDSCFERCRTKEKKSSQINSLKNQYSAQMDMETDSSSSQNSSPVSVFDLPLDPDHINIHDSLISEGEEVSKWRPAKIESRKKTRKCDLVNNGLSDVWSNICCLGEVDLNGSDWFTAKMSGREEAGDIGNLCGESIFDLLLQEALYDLVN